METCGPVRWHGRETVPQQRLSSAAEGPTDMGELTSPFRVGAADEYVMAFEAAWSDGDRPALADHLPPAGDPLYPQVVRELVRVDLEFGWGLRPPRPPGDYPNEFSQGFAHPAAPRE